MIQSGDLLKCKVQHRFDGWREDAGGPDKSFWRRYESVKTILCLGPGKTEGTVSCFVTLNDGGTCTASLLAFKLELA